MSTHSFYHKETGIFSSETFTTTSPNEFLIDRETPEDHIAIEGRHDRLSKRVNIQTGEVVDYQPPQPSEHHEWDDTTKRWSLNKTRQAAISKHHAALSMIHALEHKSIRAMRELCLGYEGAHERLDAIEREIIEYRKSLLSST